FEHRPDRSKAMGQVSVDAHRYRIIPASGLDCMQVVVDRILKTRKTSVVEERGLQCNISQRRGPEPVSIGRIASNLLQPEVFIMPRPVEDHVPSSNTKLRSDLRHADHVHLEVAEHFIRASADGVTAYTPRFTEKQNRALFFRNTHRPFFTTRETID